MKMGRLKRFACAALAAGMLLSMAAVSAQAAELDSVKEFREGKTKMVAAGDATTFVLQEDGSLWGWGRVNEGLLGNDGKYDDEETINKSTTYRRTYPEKILTGVTFVDVGNVTTVIKSDGTLWYTGGVTKVESMGMVDTKHEYQKNFIKLDNSVVSVSSGNDAIYAVKSNGELWEFAFEYVHDSGPEVINIDQAPEASSAHYELKKTLFMSGVDKVSASTGHVLALKKDGSVWAWGSNQHAQIGNGKHGQGFENEITTPIKVLEDSKNIYVSSTMSAAIKNDGSLWMWGQRPDQEQQYIDGEISAGFSATPIQVSSNVKDFAADDLAALLKDDGSIWALGSWWVIFRTEDIQLRDLSLKSYVDIEINGQTIFLLKEDGSLWAMGNSTTHNFGMDATSAMMQTPMQLTGMKKSASTDEQTLPKATPTSSKVLVNGKETAFNAYEINGNNYFKLRDIASVLSASGKQFDVSWDNDKQAINLLSGKTYTVVGGELTKGDSSNKTATLNTSKVYLDGKEINLTAYTIDGNNYFKLRDLGQTFNFGVGWDGAANTVTIDTSASYTAE